MTTGDDARRRAGETKRRRSRQALLEAGQDLWMKEGVPIQELTMRRIAAQAGVSEATAYKNFASASEVIREGWQQVRGTIESLFEQDIVGTDGREFLTWFPKAISVIVNFPNGGTDEETRRQVITHFRDAQILGAITADVDAEDFVNYHLAGAVALRDAGIKETTRAERAVLAYQQAAAGVEAIRRKAPESGISEQP